MLPERPIPVPEDLTERLLRLREGLEGRAELQAVVLFGSLARGTAHVWSDADVGVLVSQPLAYETRGDLLLDLERALGRPVDLVDLARAPLSLRGRAVRDAVPIAINDPVAWTRFVARATLDWLDYRPTFERAVRIASRRLAEASR